ncbi:MAG: hypothetical protein PHV76_02700 [Bacteroidales bacterium]|jgi:hypothetical protein|nr:hypothetical protein [Bacteroidales bacterium]MDD4068195.1 hypothetical protein [Bacteroidales bacterium]
MSKKISGNRHISEELLARYLENKVSEEERKEVLNYISSNETSLEEMVTLSKEIAYLEIETQKSESIYSRSLLSKEDLDDDLKNQIAGQGKQSMAAYGSESKTCAIDAQRIILQDYGINVSNSELLSIAKSNGWFIDRLGSPLDFVGELLNYFNVKSVQMRNANIYHLIHELSQGHRIIVGVDSKDLSKNEALKDYDDVLKGEEADHVLVVAGIDTTNPENVQITLTDPTNSDFQKSFPAKQFLQAWEDSGYFMVATTHPAPLTLNPEMQNFDYKRGYIQKIADITYDEIIKRLAIEGYIQQKNNWLKNLLIAIIIFLILCISVFYLWRFFTPINMRISLLEDKNYKIPSMLFEKGVLSLSYANMQEEKYNLSSDTKSIVSNDINYKYKNEKAHIVFSAKGYQTIDTVIKINKTINLPLRRDNSLSIVFGHIIDASTNKPIEGVSLFLQDISTKSGALGKFEIDIPFNKQFPSQRLIAQKKGYQRWVGTYQPSQTNPWEIVLIPE